MAANIQYCRYLPGVEPGMTHRCLTELAKDSPEFYFKALQYGHYLWLKGHAGRAILSITRALYADIKDADPVLREWPLPYAALKWIVANHNSDDFPGNPRISFQHQATRLRGKRRELRRVRAWAAWALVRSARPTLPGDICQQIEEPGFDAIYEQLTRLGGAAEADLWKTVLGPDSSNNHFRQ